MHQDKSVTVELERKNKEIIVTIQDQGEGFNWNDYISFSPERALAPNGRGIYIASKMFKKMEFLNNGSTVRCVAEAI